MQHQVIHLQQELKLAKEEKSRALQELEELRWRMSSEKNAIKNSVRSKAKMEMLEADLEKARESERKMLESLTSQTKQLEQTKISLEEAKLDVRSLNESIKILEGSANRGPRTLGKSITLDAVHGNEEIGVLRTELRLALEAEEKSKKAMDDLAMALKEVSTESKKTQLELGSTRAENEHLKSMIKHAEEKLRVALEESRRLKFEAEETFGTWSEKENGFINCMKMSEEEITSLKRENGRLVDSQRAAREEISKLRDILKQAINEANVVKEALEIARTENSQLKDALSGKDKAFQSMKQELECLKVSEAAALDSVKELQSLLVAASSMDSSRNTNPFESGSLFPAKAPANEVRARKPMARFPSDQWRVEDLNGRAGGRHSLGDSERFEGSIFDMVEPPEQRKDQAVALMDKSYENSVSFDDSDHINGRQLEKSEFGWESPMRQRKKRQILRRFGDILRRRSFQK
ncbi:WEB family protein At3g02930, chloroplastic-like [Phoenix dactylifera]|uniref:WEB family protein At3g02930, chloroplastic-like n=1 Tax=Phoenix dactylifera TaxID=42345 RepID=A0A8B7BNR3_PHODC|nr:WEB family protein At3g02930, chloroplastic-like [Phoenix dactylifera]